MFVDLEDNQPVLPLNDSDYFSLKKAVQLFKKAFSRLLQSNNMIIP